LPSIPTKAKAFEQKVELVMGNSGCALAIQVLYFSEVMKNVVGRYSVINPMPMTVNKRGGILGYFVNCMLFAAR